MRKNKSKAKKWPLIMSFKALVILGLILISPKIASATDYQVNCTSTGWCPSESGYFTTSLNLVSATLSWNTGIYGTSTEANTLFLVTQKNVGSRCYSDLIVDNYIHFTSASGGSCTLEASPPAPYDGYYISIAPSAHPPGPDQYMTLSDTDNASSTKTRIIDFTPSDGAVITGPNVTFTLTAYVNEKDIGQFIGVKFTLHNIDQNVLLLSAFSPNDIYLLDGFNATTSGYFYYSTTTVVGDGNYRLNAKLQRSFFGDWLVNFVVPLSPLGVDTLSSVTQDLSHQFVIGTSTWIGNISQNGYTELQAILGNTSATSTLAMAKTCNPISGDFSIIECGTFLLIPGGNELDITIKSLHDGVLTRAPWGYLTRVYNIWNTSATTSLPAFTATIMYGSGSESPQTTTLSFDPGDMIAGAGALLEDTRDPIYGKNMEDIFGPIVGLVIAGAVIFTIIADLTGSHRHAGMEKQTKLS